MGTNPYSVFGKDFVDIQNALALLSNPSLGTNKKKTVMELLGALLSQMDFMKRRGNLVFGEIFREVPEKRLFFFQHWNTLEIRDFSQTKNGIVSRCLKSIPMKKNGDLSAFFFNTLLQQQYFQRLFLVSYDYNFTKIFPAYAT